MTVTFTAWAESYGPQIPAALLSQAPSPARWGRGRKAAIRLSSLENPKAEFPTTTRIVCYFTLWEKDRSTSLPIFSGVRWFSVLVAWLIAQGALKTTRARAPSQNNRFPGYSNGQWTEDGGQSTADSLACNAELTCEYGSKARKPWEKSRERNFSNNIILQNLGGVLLGVSK